MTNEADRMSFRPLAGIMVLMAPSSSPLIPLNRRFPSPCGDYGSYTFKGGNIMTSKKNTFPSPCGDYGAFSL